MQIFFFFKYDSTLVAGFMDQQFYGVLFPWLWDVLVKVPSFIVHVNGIIRSKYIHSCFVVAVGTVWWQFFV